MVHVRVLESFLKFYQPLMVAAVQSHNRGVAKHSILYYPEWLPVLWMSL